MNILTKTVECGEYVFEIATDRAIAVKTFEAFPTFIEKAVNGDILSSGNENDLFIKAIQQKKLGELLEVQEQLFEIAAYALPLMIKKKAAMKHQRIEFLNMQKKTTLTFSCQTRL